VTGSLFDPIYAQIEPGRLGEIDRAVRISVEYGERIAQNLKPDSLERLVVDYPSMSSSLTEKKLAICLSAFVSQLKTTRSGRGDISPSLATYPLPNGQNQPLPVFIDEVIPTKGATYERQRDTDGASGSASPAEGSSSIPTDGETPTITERSRGAASRSPADSGWRCFEVVSPKIR